MITGANTNVRYRGILFHVQTEDSGRSNPHIISHVYHRGTILGTRKTDYSEHLDSDDLVGVVRELIETQHGEMVAKLNGGGFDDVIDERLGDASGGPSKSDTQPESKEPSRPGRGRKPPPEPPPMAALRSGGRAFGEGIGSSKPLDEVILDYLADKARSRASDAPTGAARKSRSRG